MIDSATAEMKTFKHKATLPHHSPHAYLLYAVVSCSVLEFEGAKDSLIGALKKAVALFKEIEVT